MSEMAEAGPPIVLGIANHPADCANSAIPYRQRPGPVRFVMAMQLILK
jgi:hypothetical protein